MRHVEGGLDATEQHDPFWLAWEREGLAALGHGVGGHPAAAPDEAVRFVVAAPHEPVVGRADAVAAVSADQAGEHCVVVPGGRAQERDVASGSYQGAAFAVGDQRVLAQHVGGGSDEVAGRASGHGATIRA